MSKLLIVESPGKIKKIKSILGNDFIIMASVGHIRDLSKDYNAIDYDNNFNPKYEILKDKINVINNLKKVYSKVKEVIIASDGDREGEAIAYHLIEILKIRKYKRIVFNEITKKAIEEALLKPRLIDMNMFYSQQTRRILDRIVGYKLSPLLKKIKDIESNNLGAGRVQSVVTKLIVEKEHDINKFMNNINNSTYNIIGEFMINNNKLNGNYEYYKYKKIKINNIKNYIYKKANIKNLNDIKIILLNIKLDPKFVIDNINNIERNKNPLQPYITSTLQQEASYKLKFQLKKTMQIAQKLYEKGLITYMRTDSPNISIQALNDIKNYIIKTYGDDYYEFRIYKTKDVLAQEAHEAIRPTNINIINNNDLTNEEQMLYLLIWKRTIASQMKSALYIDQNIILKNKLNINFKCVNSLLKYDGFLKLYDIKLSNKEIIIDNDVKWTRINIKETYNNPPIRYNEGSLVKKLETLGIGRPSTYANIISKIQEHKYIKIDNIIGIKKKVNNYILEHKNLKIINKITNQYIGNEKLKLIPTNDGIKVTNFLVNNFPNILDYKFTANMELLLDNIVNGKKIWFEVLDEFYKIFKKQLYNCLYKI